MAERELQSKCIMRQVDIAHSRYLMAHLDQLEMVKKKHFIEFIEFIGYSVCTSSLSEKDVARRGIIRIDEIASFIGEIEYCF